jgi:hypothetical protein
MSRAHPRRPSRRTTRRGVVASAAGALVIAAALVWQSAYAGFSDSTANLPASISTGTVAVSNNVEGFGALTLPEMRPGDSNTQCVIVTSTGSEPALVKLYAQDRTGNADIASNLTFVWSAGTGGGAYGDCTGFVASGSPQTVKMSNFAMRYADGYLPWNTAGGAAAETRTYRITYTMSTNPPSSTKGTTAGITFVWGAQQR